MTALSHVMGASVPDMMRRRLVAGLRKDDPRIAVQVGNNFSTPSMRLQIRLLMTTLPLISLCTRFTSCY